MSTPDRQPLILPVYFPSSATDVSALSREGEMKLQEKREGMFVKGELISVFGFGVMKMGLS